MIDVYYHHEWNRNDTTVRADFIGLRAMCEYSRNNGLFRIETNGGKISDRINNVEREYNGYQQTFMGGVRYAASEQADIFLVSRCNSRRIRNKLLQFESPRF